jgi:hypothetical protein
LGTRAGRGIERMIKLSVLSFYSNLVYLFWRLEKAISVTETNPTWGSTLDMRAVKGIESFQLYNSTAIWYILEA